MSLKNRIMLWVFSFILLISVVLTVTRISDQKEQLIAGIDAKLLTSAHFAGAILPAGYHDQIQNKKSVSREQYESIVEKFNKLCLELNLQNLWSVMLLEDQIVFTSATSSSKDVKKRDHATFLEVHSNPQAYLKVFKTMAVQYRTDRNKWGEVRVVLLPFLDKQGRKFLFGAAMTLSDVNAQITAAIRESIIIAFMILVVAIILGYMLAESLSKPITQLLSATEKIAQGDLTQHIAIKGSREIKNLSGSINLISKSIKTQLAEIEQRNQRLHTEINDRQTLQIEQAESKKKYKSMFDNMLNGLALHEIVVDEKNQPVDYIYKEINSSFEKMTGLERETTIGKKVTEIIPNIKEDKTNWIALYGKVAQEGTPIVMEEYAEQLNRWYNISAYSPKPGFFTTAIEEITDRKQAEMDRELLIKDLESKNAELERFTYTVSHDLKSPLITIKGFLGMLKSDAIDRNIERMTSDINRISNAADKMQRLLDELLELSRIGRIVTPYTSIPFKDLAQKAVDSIAGRIRANDAMVKIEATSVEIKGDVSRLLEVMENLVDNAVKFSSDQAHSKITIGSKAYGGETVYFVKDNGLGIKPQYHEKVFGLFEKLDQNAEGTGIGLAIVKRVIEVHGGRIWIESDGVARGTTFCFTLTDKTN